MTVVKVVEADEKLRRYVVDLAYRLFGDEAYWVEAGFRWEPRWVRTLVLFIGGTPVGFNQVYVWPCCGLMVGVHHYVGVEPRFQGRGYGKVLIASGEEVLEMMGAELFAATLRAWNTRSRRVLESMCYTILSWDKLVEVLGEGIVSDLEYATGGYTDDLVALKYAKESWRDPIQVLASRSAGRSQRYGTVE